MKRWAGVDDHNIPLGSVGAPTNSWMNGFGMIRPLHPRNAAIVDFHLQSSRWNDRQASIKPLRDRRGSSGRTAHQDKPPTGRDSELTSDPRRDTRITLTLTRRKPWPV